MMKLSTVFGALATIVVLTGAAEAVTLTNEDDKTYEVTVTVGQGEGASESTLEIAPGETVADLCKEVCTISLSEDVQQTFSGQEAVAIKGGNFTLSN